MLAKQIANGDVATFVDDVCDRHLLGEAYRLSANSAADAPNAGHASLRVIRDCTGKPAKKAMQPRLAQVQFETDATAIRGTLLS